MFGIFLSDKSAHGVFIEVLIQSLKKELNARKS
jgi:hypothetical protein